TSGAVLQVEFDGVITAVDELIATQECDEWLAPGFIDVQVNGFAGVDYNDPSATPEAIAGSIRMMFQTGVTRFFATVITGSEEHMLAALRNLAKAKAQFRASGLPEAEAMEGFHVEGPHICAEDGPRGAHPREQVRPPDTNEFDRWQEAAEGNIRLVTVSPEWPTTPEYVRHLAGRGVVASVGHTKATGEQIKAAVDAGASMSTHLGNAAHAVLPKTENYIWHQLTEDRLAASFIVDGIHIPGVFLQAGLRCKGTERSVLVTDAVMPAMCPPGPYRLGEVEVELKGDNSVVLRGGTRLAGSALRMDHAIGNAVRLGRVSLQEALAMATVNPARVARIAGRQRGVAAGEKADLVRFAWNAATAELSVKETIVSGVTVFNA
ncbi:MAG: amidohydrolase family protein, partial [Acidobacteriaceae bacterium]|nr:amidohydrolase family protein [Acidobacteriaceae bacterium]